MSRMWLACVVVAAVLALHALSLADAQSPAQFEVIERYAALVNDGAKAPLRAMFSHGVTHAELGLYWNEERGTAALPALFALIDAGARLEVEFHAAASAGDVIITRERMWVDGAAEALAPLRSTGVYVVDGDRILSVTRVVDADQREVLMREALVGRWKLLHVATTVEFDAGGACRRWLETSGSKTRAERGVALERAWSGRSTEWLFGLSRSDRPWPSGVSRASGHATPARGVARGTPASRRR